MPNPITFNPRLIADALYRSSSYICAPQRRVDHNDGMPHLSPIYSFQPLWSLASQSRLIAPGDRTAIDRLGRSIPTTQDGKASRQRLDDGWLIVRNENPKHSLATPIFATTENDSATPTLRCLQIGTGQWCSPKYATRFPIRQTAETYASDFGYQVGVDVAIANVAFLNMEPIGRHTTK